MKFVSLRTISCQSLVRAATRQASQNVTRPVFNSVLLRNPGSNTLRFYSDSTEISAIPKDVITKRIIEVLKKYEKIDPETVTAEAHFSKDLKLDSLDAVEVVMAIEEEFSIEIPDQAADEIKSVANAIAYVSSRTDAH